ncbi:MAG: hypothetical protein AB4080_01045 [Trichodesmium sp.]
METIFKTASFSGDKLSVLVADSFYSQRYFIGERVKQKKLNYFDYYSEVIEYFTVNLSGKKPKITSGISLGMEINLTFKDENTWHEPTRVSQSIFTTKKGR